MPRTKRYNFCYQKKRIIAIIPHEDDELNILGGLYEQLVLGRNEVYVIFYTNGDYNDISISKRRINESISYLEAVGVNINNIIFLGCGDLLTKENQHIYNAKRTDDVYVSSTGMDRMYSFFHGDFNKGKLLTRENILYELKEMIEKIQPDVVFCNDLDSHPDHRALSLWMDKVISNFIKQGHLVDYYKAFAYATAFRADKDFYDLKHNSTTINNEFMPGYYVWSERIRFPLSNGYTSKSRRNNPLYSETKFFKSQNMRERFERIANNDKVFWRRSIQTDFMNATVYFNGNITSELNDGLVRDSTNINKKQINFDRGYVSPTFGLNNITVELNEQISLFRIDIYGSNLNKCRNIVTKKKNEVIQSATNVYQGLIQVIFNECVISDEISVYFEVDEIKEIKIFEVEKYLRPNTNGNVIAFVDPMEGDIINQVFLKPGTKKSIYIYSYPFCSDLSDCSSIKTSAGCEVERDNNTLLIKTTNWKKHHIVLSSGLSSVTLDVYPPYHKYVQYFSIVLDRIAMIPEDAYYCCYYLLKRVKNKMKKLLGGR